MKPLLFFSVIVITLSACEVNIVEPVYDPRDNVLGSYNMDEYSETYNEVISYRIHISKSFNSTNEIYLDNFYGVDVRVYAYLDNYKIVIPFQVVDGYEIEGIGTKNSNTINFNYKVRDTYKSTISDFCQTNATRAY